MDLTLKDLSQPAMVQVNGRSPVCEWRWILSDDGLENGFEHWSHTYRSRAVDEVVVVLPDWLVVSDDVSDSGDDGSRCRLVGV